MIIIIGKLISGDWCIHQYNFFYREAKGLGFGDIPL
jgi:hypothetical protein